MDAVCLCGLELRGASWDAELGALQDTVCVEPCVLPLVCVKAQVKSTDASLEASSCKNLHKKDCSNVQVAHGSPSIVPQLPLYHCPLYLGGDIITTIPLHTKLLPVLCSLRRVRLVSVL